MNLNSFLLEYCKNKLNVKIMKRKINIYRCFLSYVMNYVCYDKSCIYNFINGKVIYKVLVDAHWGAKFIPKNVINLLNGRRRKNSSLKWKQKFKTLKKLFLCKLNIRSFHENTLSRISFFC